MAYYKVIRETISRSVYYINADSEERAKAYASRGEYDSDGVIASEKNDTITCAGLWDNLTEYTVLGTEHGKVVKDRVFAPNETWAMKYAGWNHNDDYKTINVLVGRVDFTEAVA